MKMFCKATLFFLVAGCGASSQASPEIAVPTQPTSTTTAGTTETPPTADKNRDRSAILAMAGDYEVSFYFQETVPLADGYSLWAPYDSAATEFVEVIEDTSDHISMQHVLVLGGRVVKHWRQDWTYEDDSYYQFRGRLRWEKRTLTMDEKRGTWVQRVFQVDDSPRYASHGRWKHEAGGVSSWQSAPTWRPLPRREYTKREDYQVLIATNRHTLTADGWVHEQDNTKLVLDDDGNELKRLAREVGLNTYTKTTKVDFEVGRAYWSATADYWKDVRAWWALRYASGEPIVLRKDVDDKPMWQHMFGMAGEVQKAGTYDANSIGKRITATLDRFAIPADH